MIIETERIYAAPRNKGGYRVLVDQLIYSTQEKPLVLLSGARNTAHNQAVELKEYPGS